MSLILSVDTASTYRHIAAPKSTRLSFRPKSNPKKKCVIVEQHTKGTTNGSPLAREKGHISRAHLLASSLAYLVVYDIFRVQQGCLHELGLKMCSITVRIWRKNIPCPWKNMHHSMSTDLERCRRFTDATFVYSDCYQANMRTAYYPCTDFSRNSFSFLVFVVMIDARVIQLGSPLARMARTRS